MKRMYHQSKKGDGERKMKSLQAGDGSGGGKIKERDKRTGSD